MIGCTRKKGTKYECWEQIHHHYVPCHVFHRFAHNMNGTYIYDKELYTVANRWAGVLFLPFK